MCMFADDANTGNRRGCCHFLYWKTSIPLIEFIDYDSGWVEGSSFVKAHDPPAALHGPFSSLLRLRLVAVPLQAEKHLRIRTSNMYLDGADSLPS